MRHGKRLLLQAVGYPIHPTLLGEAATMNDQVKIEAVCSWNAQAEQGGSDYLINWGIPQELFATCPETSSSTAWLIMGV